MSKGKRVVSLSVIALVLVAGVLVGPLMSNVEQPNYEVIERDEHIEVRRYAPMIIAEVEVVGEREAVLGDGFRLLADYIFGNNAVQTDIAMTAPVQQVSAEHTKIPMTAPVEQQPIGDQWRVSFVMPSAYTLQSLPKPNNDRVTLTQVPAKQFAVIRFSGTYDQANIQKHEAMLLDYIDSTQLEVLGDPKYAFYNPPWTLPVLRRNEVMIEVK